MVFLECLEYYNVIIAIAIAALAFVANWISRGNALAYRYCDQNPAIFCGVLIYMIPAALSVIMLALFAIRLVFLPLLIWAIFYEGANSGEVVEIFIVYGKGVLASAIIVSGNLLSIRLGKRLAR